MGSIRRIEHPKESYKISKIHKPKGLKKSHGNKKGFSFNKTFKLLSNKAKWKRP